ncbi:uncharacterized protein LOC125946977 [Dermacentor silvarum]|uniref:uncharacterized protein LOC125946977 n=1 Tax=Dermacentor silvarum TaxID=543639 RepID=UPI0021018B89|nr:uncharacterized protein LOC125946977 [Dermacentor silvarum]
MSLPSNRSRKSRQSGLPLQSLPASRAGYVHALPWGLPLHHRKGESTPLPRFTINERGGLQVEPLGTLDLPRPPETNVRREILRGCALASALVFLFVAVMTTALLVHGARNLFGHVEDATTDASEDVVIQYKDPPAPKSTSRYNNGTRSRGGGDEPGTGSLVEDDSFDTTTAVESSARFGEPSF